MPTVLGHSLENYEDLEKSSFAYRQLPPKNTEKVRNSILFPYNLETLSLFFLNFHFLQF